MPRKDAVLLASRTLALLLTVWALSEMSYLPERLYSLLHYVNEVQSSSIALQYWRHHYLLELGFLAARIIGFLLMAFWLRNCGSEVQQLLLPVESEKGS